ncbi:hypothetical protein, partial [Microbispora triticiradicis]|uniref:hypothetical protein n=1 Tax=Microbispora triticiradicis TaxID=2200763 RepID=UPI001AD67039
MAYADVAYADVACADVACADAACAVAADVTGVSSAADPDDERAGHSATGCDAHDAFTPAGDCSSAADSGHADWAPPGGEHGGGAWPGGEP